MRNVETPMLVHNYFFIVMAQRKARLSIATDGPNLPVFAMKGLCC